jgi:RimJ/RimL family protein N-acetyltransferase
MADYTVEVANDEGFAFVNRYFNIYWSAWTKAIVQRRDGEIVAAVLYQDANAHNVFAHIVMKPGARLTRNFLYWIFAYPFLQLKMSRITGWVSSTNAAAIKFDEHLGFKREATLKGAGQNGEDVYLYVMHREGCRYV